jgi:hypothetical protein
MDNRWKPHDEKAFWLRHQELLTTGTRGARQILQREFNGTDNQVGKYISAHRPTKPIAEPVNLEGRILQILKTKSPSVNELADLLDTSPKRIQTALESLSESGYCLNEQSTVVSIGTPTASSRSERHAEYLDGSRVFRFGIATDAHLCSKYAREDHLNTFFDLCQQEGVSVVYDLGNQIDGEARFNRQDIHTHGLGNQVRYWVDHWPQRDGITTEFICGDDHEGWYVQREGLDIGRYMQMESEKAGRTDLRYLGYMEHDVEWRTPEGGSTRVRLQHPGGGSAYAVSYTPQKIIESLSGGDKPHILLLGHYHKAGYFFTRSVHCILGGCFMDQSPFMRKKRLAAHVGGWIIEVTQAPDGSVLRLKSVFVPFYGDNVNEAWAYQMAG